MVKIAPETKLYIYGFIRYFQMRIIYVISPERWDIAIWRTVAPVNRLITNYKDIYMFIGKF